MPDIPDAAFQAASEAMEAEDGNRTYFTFTAMARTAVEAAAPFIAEQARAEERAAIVEDLRTFAESDDPLSAQDREFIGHHAYHASGAVVAAVMLAIADKIEKGRSGA
ncbi:MULTISPECIES: hypothetical protein [Streptosporangium]|uniref:Uncharacterized protein n=1 Tax=Streptosporangium jomthongense TaxID=1193683 RepID=A0ABV8FCQ6_9ACTN